MPPIMPEYTACAYIMGTCQFVNVCMQPLLGCRNGGCLCGYARIGSWAYLSPGLTCHPVCSGERYDTPFQDYATMPGQNETPG